MKWYIISKNGKEKNRFAGDGSNGEEICNGAGSGNYQFALHFVYRDG